MELESPLFWPAFLEHLINDPCEAELQDHGSVSACIHFHIEHAASYDECNQDFRAAFKEIIHEWRPTDNLNNTESRQLFRILELIQEFRPLVGLTPAMELIRNHHYVPLNYRNRAVEQAIAIACSYFTSRPLDPEEKEVYYTLTRRLIALWKDQHDEFLRAWGVAGLLAIGAVDTSGRILLGNKRDNRIVDDPPIIELVVLALGMMLDGSALDAAITQANELISSDDPAFRVVGEGILRRYTPEDRFRS